MDPSFIIILLFAVGALWFMSSRTRKQQQEAGRFRDNLEAGQEVMTGSGLFGTVVDVEGDRVTLETSPGVTSQWLKPAIAKLVEPPFEEPMEDDEGEYDEDDDEYEEYDEDEDEYADDEAVEGELLDDEVVEAEADAADEGAEEEWDDVDVPDDASSLTPDEGDEKPR